METIEDLRQHASGIAVISRNRGRLPSLQRWSAPELIYEFFGEGSEHTLSRHEGQREIERVDLFLVRPAFVEASHPVQELRARSSVADCRRSFQCRVNSARACLEANDDNSVGERSSQCAEDRHSNYEQDLSHDVMDEPLCGRPYPRHGAV